MTFSVLVVWIIGMAQIGALAVVLAMISIWRGRLPYPRDVAVCLAAAAATGIVLWAILGPAPAGPLPGGDRVTPSPYGPPPPGWTGVPA